MRNHDEFRRLVFEKAEKYEKQRKARNKKILNSALICSLVLAICLPIGTYVYKLHDDAFPAEGTTSLATLPEAGTTAAQTTTEMTFATTTEALMTTTEATYATTEATMEATYATTTTTYTTTTYATTTETVLTTTAATAVETTIAEEETTTAGDGTVITPYLLANGTTTDSTIFSHLATYEKNTAFHRFSNVSQLSCFALGNAYGIDLDALFTVCDEEFFKTKKILAVETLHRYTDQYAMSGTDGTLIFQAGDGSVSYLYFFAIDKDSHFNIQLLP